MTTTKAMVHGYIDDVLSGRRVVGKLERLCVQRHLKDLNTGASRGLSFNERAAEYAVNFFGCLRHSKGEWAGRVFELAPMQLFNVWVVFGWYRLDGTRRFRVAYNSMARKNGKSTLAAGIGLYCLVADEEPGAEIYTAATKLDQARIVHSEAIRMVKASPDLLELCSVFKNNISIISTSSKFEPLGSDSTTLDGLNTHTAIADEIHAWPTGNLWDILETSTGARRNPLMYAITTAGFDRTSFCYEMDSHARKVLEGIIEDDSFFGYIAAMDPGDDWLDEDVWCKPNPLLDVSVKRDRIREGVKQSLESTGRRNAFQRLRLNVWTQQQERWIDIDKWDLCGERINEEDLRGRRCYAAMDLASTTDITAVALVFPFDDGSVKVVMRMFVPEDTAAERQRRDRVPYLQWIKEGWLIATPGNVCDYDMVRSEINELGAKFNIDEFSYDTWNATDLATRLQRDGFLMVQARQTFSTFAPACASFDRLLAGGKLSHGGNPVLRWMASNVQAKQDSSGNIRPDKATSGEKIDGMVAMLMAIGRSSVNENSVYEERGMLEL